MKKKLLLLLLPVLFLVGCSDKIDQDYLMSQTWSVEFEKETPDEMVLISEFDKEMMLLKIDPDSISTTASNDMEEIGMEMAKKAIAEMKYEIKYKLDGKKIHLENKDLDINGDFDVTKKDNNIIFANSNTGVKLTLKPYKKEKVKKIKESSSELTSNNSISKESVEAFSDVETSITNNTEQQNINDIYNETTQTMPITEYKVPTEEDIKKTNEELKAKENEPQYAIFTEESVSIWRFTNDNGISEEKFYELNPGVSKPVIGQTYRIK